MLYTLKEVTYGTSIARGQICLLAADIGGTNSNFGFFQVQGTHRMLLFSLHAKSQEVIDFTDLLKQVLAYANERYAITVQYACFAAAGVVSTKRDYCKPTNLSYTISSKEILLNTSLHCAIIVNDFEVIGHGISEINSTSLVRVHQGRRQHHGGRAIVGAGTGLGKCSLLWDFRAQRYMPLVSEGGHADFSVQHQLELDLIEFIRASEQRTSNISWEDILSGNGIKRIYHFFRARNTKLAINIDIAQQGLHPDLIFKNKDIDQHCFNTYQLYLMLYARFAKNAALDSLAVGGLYIAGGIAAHNLELFQDPLFTQEFTNCGKHKELLNQIPVFVITDYNVSLYGAAAYLQLEKLCE